MADEINIELFKRLKEGDETAFEIIFKSFFEQLVSFANEYVFDREISKGIVQETFIKLWKKRVNIDVEANVKAFLYTITKNSCLSYLRHVKTKQKYFEKRKKDFEDLMLNYEALSQLEIDRIDFNTIEKIIKETVESMPPRCKEVFTLSRFEELSNKKIAEKLEISVKAVEANNSRAIKLLRKNLRDYLQPAIVVLVMELIS